MKNTYKILIVCLMIGFAFSRISDKYQTLCIHDLSITSVSHNKTLSEYDYGQNENSVKWKRRHKRRKKMRRKKRGM